MPHRKVLQIARKGVNRATSHVDSAQAFRIHSQTKLAISNAVIVITSTTQDYVNKNRDGGTLLFC